MVNFKETPQSQPSGTGKKGFKFNTLWIYLIIGLAFFGVSYWGASGSAVEGSWREVKNNMLPAGDIEKIVVVRNEGIAEIYLKPDRLEKYKKKFNKATPSKHGPHFYFKIGSVDSFDKNLSEAQATIPEPEKVVPEYEERTDYFGGFLSYIFPLLLIVGFWVFMMRRMSGQAGGQGGPGGIFNVGKSKAQLFDKNGSHVKITFNEVAGLEEAKVEVMEIVDFLKNPKRYTDLGGKIPKGALLVGPPGTGKTLLAKAVAGEADVPFFSLSGSDFVEMFVGVGASRVRDLFKSAKEKSPCIIFIDEIDAIGRARGNNSKFNTNDERENTLNQLLTEMDGFGTNSGVIILAATNRADVLDKALLRAGRFDRQILIDLPDLKEREQIFDVHLRALKLEEGFDRAFLAKQSPGFSGADIANVCNEAALIAARKAKPAIQRQDFLDAIDRMVGGLERKNRLISPEEKKTIAFHEAGHATVSWMLEYANPLVKVTIIPRGRALGAAWYLPEERQITTVEQLTHEMASTLGGRASEEMIFGRISTGALNDLERVTKQAYAMVAYYGMSDGLKNMSYFDSSGQSEYFLGKPYSEKTAEQIDKEVKSIVSSTYRLAQDILEKNREGLETLANLLLEKEVIFSDDLEVIFGKRKTS